MCLFSITGSIRNMVLMTQYNIFDVVDRRCSISIPDIHANTLTTNRLDVYTVGFKLHTACSPIKQEHNTAKESIWEIVNFLTQLLAWHHFFLAFESPLLVHLR